MIKSLPIIFLAMLFAWSFTRNLLWVDEFAFWSDSMAKSPHKPRPFNDLGMTFRRRGDIRRAMELFFTATAVNANYHPALTNILEIYDTEGRIGDIVPIFLDLARRHPTAVNLQYMTGRALILLGDVEEGIRFLLRALAIDPAMPAATDDLRLITDYKRSLGKALRDPLGKDELYNLLGTIYGKNGNLDKAMAYFARSISANPSFSMAHDNVGVLYFKSGQVDRAIRHFEAAVKASPESIAALNHLGIAYLRSGNPGRAREEFIRALTLDPANPETRDNLRTVSAYEGGPRR